MRNPQTATLRQLNAQRLATLCVIAFGMHSSSASAQQQDEQLWLQVNTVLPVTKKVGVTLEQIARFSDHQDGLYQTELGGLLTYRPRPNLELGFGYRRVGAHNGNTGADEDRIRQQVIVTVGRISTRFRVDERFNPRGDQVGVRVRPLIRYNQPLARKGLALFFSHESFLLPNSTTWGQRSGYERMRNIIGTAITLKRGLNLDVGYLDQFRLGRGGARPQMDHALTLQLTINLRDLAPTHLDD